MGLRRRWDERGRVEAGIEGWEVVRLRLQLRGWAGGQGGGRPCLLRPSASQHKELVEKLQRRGRKRWEG